MAAGPVECIRCGRCCETTQMGPLTPADFEIAPELAGICVPWAKDVAEPALPVPCPLLDPSNCCSIWTRRPTCCYQFEPGSRAVCPVSRAVGRQGDE